jgi:hypothetical protein
MNCIINGFSQFFSCYSCSAETDLNFPTFATSNTSASNLTQMGYLKTNPYNFGIMTDPLLHPMGYPTGTF